MKKLILVGHLLYAAAIYGQQNLIADSSFENYTSLPPSIIQTPQELTSVLPTWYAPTNGTPDYFHVKNTYAKTTVPTQTWDNLIVLNQIRTNFQMPRTGDAYVGIGLAFDLVGSRRRYNEYLQTRFSTALVKNHTYTVSFYVNLNHCSYMAASNLGAYITADSIRQYYPNSLYYPNWTNFEQTISPQIVSPNTIYTDTTSWVRIRGTYKAKGGERWITLGHFNRDNEPWIVYDTINRVYSWMYYFIDDASVYERTGVIYPDTVCKRDIVEVSSNYLGPFEWYKNRVLVSKDSVYTFTADQSAEYILKTAAKRDTFRIVVKEDAFFHLGKDTFLCAGDTILKRVAVPNAIYYWNNIKSDSSHYLITAGGTYTAKVTKNLCSHADTINIEERVKPTLQYTKNEFCIPSDAYVQIQLDPAYSYYWESTGDTHTLQTISRPGSYIVQIRKNGCAIKSVIPVDEFCVPTIWIPSAFVPKGFNTTFAPVGINIKQYAMTIYNRWGEKLFLGTDRPWDGTYKDASCPLGMYMYVIEYTGLNNKTYTAKGMVELIE